MKNAGVPKDSIPAENMLTPENTRKVGSCIATSEALLDILRAEAEALKAFRKERLLELLSQKEAVTCELAQKIKELESSLSSFERSGKASPNIPESTGGILGNKGQGDSKTVLLRELLGEIVKCNQRNHVFIQGSLGFWQDFLSLCIPGVYISGHGKQATKQPMCVKGFSLNREI